MLGRIDGRGTGRRGTSHCVAFLVVASLWARPGGAECRTTPASAMADLARCARITAAERDRLRGVAQTRSLRIHARSQVVLAWPVSDTPTAWYAEAGVGSPGEVADLLNRAHLLLQAWTGHTPGGESRPPARLLYLRDGSRDFVFGDGRARIGLRDGRDPPVGTEDWFGWLLHETAHDVVHEHPVLARVKSVWGEGLCDWFRYELLQALGMPRAAARERRRHLDGDPANRYHGGARLLIRKKEALAPSAPGTGPLPFLRWLEARLRSARDATTAMALHVGAPTWILPAPAARNSDGVPAP